MQDMDHEFLDIRQLEAFSAVMSIESVTGAARMLGRSQPAVTRSLQDMEAAIGFELFHRNGPRLIPTEKGLAFSREVERFLVGLRLMRERARTIGSETPQMVTIACTQSFAAGLATHALSRIEAGSMPARVYIEAALPEHVRQSILSRSADFGIVSLPVSLAGIELRFVGEMPCVAAVSSDDPLARNDVIPISALHGGRLIAMADTFRMRRRVDAALAKAGAKPASVVEVSTSVTAMAAARAGLGVSIIEPSTGYGVPLEGVAVRPLDVHIPYYWAVITAEGSHVAPPVEAIVEQVRRVAEAEFPGLTVYPPERYKRLLSEIYSSQAPPVWTRE